VDYLRSIVTAYDPSEWSDLFVAAAGASAALAGLLFVAVSINVDRIIRLPGVPERAMQALMQLILLVVVSLLMLAPGQSPEALGIEALIAGLFGVALSLKWIGDSEDPDVQSPSVVRRAVAMTGTVPLVIGGISLIAESGGGLYWILAGVALGTIGAVVNAWVLLVEILR
jgi:hypothetical protein